MRDDVTSQLHVGKAQTVTSSQYEEARFSSAFSSERSSEGALGTGGTTPTPGSGDAAAGAADEHNSDTSPALTQRSAMRKVVTQQGGKQLPRQSAHARALHGGADDTVRHSTPLNDDLPDTYATDSEMCPAPPAALSPQPVNGACSRVNLQWSSSPINGTASNDTLNATPSTATGANVGLKTEAATASTAKPARDNDDIGE